MKDIVSLRNHLFDALNRLADATDDELETEVQKSAAIVQVSETIIKTAEVENQFIAITKGYGSGFIPVVNDKPTLIDILKRKTDESENKEVEMFDVDKEQNWLTAEPGPPAMGAEFGNAIPIGKIGKLASSD